MGHIIDRGHSISAGASALSKLNARRLYDPSRTEVRYVIQVCTCQKRSPRFQTNMKVTKSIAMCRIEMKKCRFGVQNGVVRPALMLQRHCEITWLEDDWGDGDGARQMCYIPIRTWHRGLGGNAFDASHGVVPMYRPVKPEPLSTVVWRCRAPVHTEYARRSFCARAVRAWNELPVDVRRSPTFATFKNSWRTLNKTHVSTLQFFLHRCAVLGTFYFYVYVYCTFTFIFMLYVHFIVCLFYLSHVWRGLLKTHLMDGIWNTWYADMIWYDMMIRRDNVWWICVQDFKSISSKMAEIWHKTCQKQSFFTSFRDLTVIFRS